MKVWIMAQCDKDLIDVSSTGWTVFKEDQVLRASASSQTADTGYPYRPEERLNLPPSLDLSGGGEPLNLKLTIRRLSDAKGDATLVLRAVGQPDYIRQEIPIRLPGRQELEFEYIVGRQPIEEEEADEILLFPKHKQELTIQVANRGEKQKTFIAALYTPQQIPAEPIPTGSIEPTAAELILRKFGRLTPVALGAQLKLSPGAPPRPLIFSFDSEENKKLLGAEATAAGPVAMPISNTLLLDLVDQETGDHTTRLMSFEVGRPRAYLKARAEYNAGTERIVITVEAIDPTRLPDGPVEVALEFDGRFFTTEEGIQIATLSKTNPQGVLQAQLKGIWPRDVDPEAEDYLPVRLRVDDYPRAFEFQIPRTTGQIKLDPVEDLTAVRLIPPEKLQYPAQPSVTVGLQIDVPIGFLSSAENYVELGIDADEDRNLRDDAPRIIDWDRDVKLSVLRPTGEGTLAFKPQVSDFERELSTAGIVGRSVNILALLRSGGNTIRRDEVPIVLDGEGPDIGVPQIELVGDELVIMVEPVDPQNLTGVSLVEGVIQSATENEQIEWKKGEPRSEGQWLVRLPTKDLPPAVYSVWIRATDGVGNVNKTLLEQWNKTETVAQPEPQPQPSGEPAVQPVKNRVSGRVTYGRQEVKNIEVKLIGAGAPAQPARIGQGGAFDFGMVPPGTYTLTARGLAGGNFQTAEVPITVSDQPETPWNQDVPIRRPRP
jgi:hypothetical protein